MMFFAGFFVGMICVFALAWAIGSAGEEDEQLEKRVWEDEE